jgi:hypothetical protein
LNLSEALDASGFLRFELGSSSDSVLLTNGTLNIGTGLSLADFSFTNAGAFREGIYTLFQTSTSIVGSLAQETTGTILGHTSTLAFANGPGGRNDLVLVVVPEPSSALIVAAAGLGLLGLVRRRERASVWL